MHGERRAACVWSEWASSMIWDGSAYVEQARIVRRLWRWRCGRGIAGGLDGEARSAFGEQELKVITRSVNTTPTQVVSQKRRDSRHKLLPPRSRSRPRPPDSRSGLSGVKKTNNQRDGFMFSLGFFVSFCAPVALLSPSLKRAEAPERESEIEVDPRTLGGRALPDAKPFFAFCVRCGRKANADRAGATAAMDA